MMLSRGWRRGALGVRRGLLGKGQPGERAFGVVSFEALGRILQWWELVLRTVLLDDILFFFSITLEPSAYTHTLRRRLRRWACRRCRQP